MPQNDIDMTLKNYYRSQEPPFPSVDQEKKMLKMLRQSRQESQWWKIAALIAIGLGLYFGTYTVSQQTIATQNQAFIGGEKEVILQKSRDRWLRPIENE